MRGCWVKLWMIGEQLCHVSIDQSDKDPKWTIMAAEHIARMLEKKHD